MRVLQVSSGLAGGRGGAERCCLELSDWLREAGVEVGIAGDVDRLTGDFPRWSLHEERRKLVRKLISDYISPANARRLRHVIEEFAPDVVHVHNIYGISSQAVRVAAEVRPTVVTLHDYWPIDVFIPRVDRGKLRYPLRHTALFPWTVVHRRIHKANLQNATLVSPSRYLAQRMTARGYQDVRVIPNGVALPDRQTTGEPLILFVGRLVQEKGFHIGLAAAVEVVSNASWNVEVVGDGPLRAQLEQDFSNVLFSGQADPEPFYRQASILAVPSLWPENLPYVILEAMSFGVTVLASNVGGISEPVEDGRTGLLVPSGDSHALADALRHLIGDDALRRRLGAAGRAKVEGEFAWSVVGPRYLKLYDELANARPRTLSERKRAAIGGRAS